MDKFIQNSGIKKVLFERFLEEFKEYEQDIEIKKVRDKFLDAYSLWLKQDTRRNKLKVLCLALKLSAIDGDFKISALFKKKAVN